MRKLQQVRDKNKPTSSICHLCEKIFNISTYFKRYILHLQLQQTFIENCRIIY